jgi:acetaldehyde dehydrogenase / alcohol dehydrogenase
MLPHVLAFNASVPSKFMPSPNQRGYIAHKKYATIAELLALGGNTVDEKVKRLIAATEQLLDKLSIPRSIADLGISRQQFEAAMPDLAKNAFDDPSWRSNPRMPLVSELVELFWIAYRGRGVAEAVPDLHQQPA